MGKEKKPADAFENPGCWFRGMPFWAWNGRLDGETLKRQIRVMKRMGLGGFFMHSRVGLATPYLSEEWFERIRDCVQEARRLGMLAWLYDEDRWPSGAAGGLVTRDPKYRKRSLVMERIAVPARLAWGPDLVAAFTARVSGTDASAVKRVPKGTSSVRRADGETLLVFRVRIDDCEDWFNGYTYLDTLSPRAVERFMEVTHEQYAARFGPEFGRTVPGIFSDEPHHGHKHAPDAAGKSRGIPWTGNLPSEFRRRYGYDLLPCLPELFLDVDGAVMTPARLDYQDCVTALFVGSFARGIGEWCGKHNMLFTGHVLAEDTLSSQASIVGSPMRFYEHMQAPGMDLLTERNMAYTTAKQVSSAARQFGRKWRITETYGCTGWDFPFLGHKGLGDWQIALGLNLLCQHLFWYTMEGEAKRDYPAAISSQSPWWETYPMVQDYFARILAIMTEGGEVREVLVIHPVESMWSMVREGWSREPRVKEYDRMLVDLEGSLLAAHIDFDYGDEEILGRLASTAKRAAGPVLKVGKAAYSAVVVPPLLTVRASTLEMLRRFHAAGGLVVFAGEAAGHVGGVPSPAPRELAGSCLRTPASGPELVRALEKTRRVSIADAEGREIPEALYMLREQKDRFCLFVCNTGVDPIKAPGAPLQSPRAVERSACFPVVKIGGFSQCSGIPLELDPSTGERHEADAEKKSDGSWLITTALPPLGSRVFVIPKARSAQRLPLRSKLRETGGVSLPAGAWSALLTEPNALLLDRPAFRVSGQEWQGPMEILRVDAFVRKAMGIVARGGRMVQPWAREAAIGKAVPVELRYTFDAVQSPDKRVFLGVERPELYAIAVNGRDIGAEAECGWWVDPSLRILPVDPAFIRAGENTLSLSCLYKEDHPGLEIVYLLGDFGVSLRQGRAVMGAAPRLLAVGDWSSQGLPFYSGSVVYRKTFRIRRDNEERLFLVVPSYRGVVVRVFVNGKDAGLFAWEPNEVDITECLARGESEAEIGIEVVGHRRNSHGPLHHAETWPSWTGPAQFVTSGAEWSDEYRLVPCGIMEEPRITRRMPE